MSRKVNCPSAFMSGGQSDTSLVSRVVDSTSLEQRAKSPRSRTEMRLVLVVLGVRTPMLSLQGPTVPPGSVVGMAGPVQGAVQQYQRPL